MIVNIMLTIMGALDGMTHYLWRAVDRDGEVVGAYLQARRDGTAAK